MLSFVDSTPPRTCDLSQILHHDLIDVLVADVVIDVYLGLLQPYVLGFCGSCCHLRLTLGYEQQKELKYLFLFF